MNNDILQPWARWLVNHKMKWLLTLYMYLLLPVFIIVGLFMKIPPVEAVIEWAECVDELENVK